MSSQPGDISGQPRWDPCWDLVPRCALHGLSPAFHKGHEASQPEKERLEASFLHRNQSTWLSLFAAAAVGVTGTAPGSSTQAAGMDVTAQHGAQPQPMAVTLHLDTAPPGLKAQGNRG